MKYPEMNHVEVCEKCRGVGEVMGLVQRIHCPACRGNRYQSLDDGQPLNVRSLCRELYETQRRLAGAEEDIARFRKNIHEQPYSTGPQRGYYGNNGRGAGGSNFTGD